jgi:hypothetical protein
MKPGVPATVLFDYSLLFLANARRLSGHGF